MRKGNRLVWLSVLVLLLVGTVLGIGLSLLVFGASDEEVDLRPEGGLIAAVDFHLLSSKGRSAMELGTSTYDYLTWAWSELVPTLLREGIGVITNAVEAGQEDLGNPIYATLLEWTPVGGKVRFYLDSDWDVGEEHLQTFSRKLPQTKRWVDEGMGFRAEQLVFAATFAYGEVASAYAFISASLPEDDLEATTEAIRVESGLKDTDWIRLVSIRDVRFDVFGRRATGVAVRYLSSELHSLSACLEQHIGYLVSEEMERALKRCGQDEARELSLQVLRGCKMRGRVYDPCGIRHRFAVSGDRGGWRSDIGILPLSVTGICYSVFGL